MEGVGAITRPRGSRKAVALLYILHSTPLCPFCPSGAWHTSTMNRNLGLCTAMLLVSSPEPGLSFPPGKLISFCTVVLLGSSTEAGTQPLWAGTLHHALSSSLCSKLSLPSAPWRQVSCTLLFSICPASNLSAP